MTEPFVPFFKMMKKTPLEVGTVEFPEVLGHS